MVTETYSGGQFDYLPGPLDQQSLTPTIEESPQEKYLSLGPNIYGLVKTLFTTFTYNNGLGRDSLEVITQTSTRVFSTTKLPASPYTEGDILHAVGVLQTNTISLAVPGQKTGLYTGLYPTFSFLSHRCMCNAKYVFFLRK